jgi:mannose-6-phosphate isomerase-like protein (cupin superfamily)
MIDEMGIERGDCLVHLPDDIEWTTSDGIFIKGMIMKRKGTMVAQHSHEYYHTSLVAKGSVRVWEGEKFIGDFKAPDAIKIPAKSKHRFQSLEDNTEVYCIHNMSDYFSLTNGKPLIHEENRLKELA